MKFKAEIDVMPLDALLDPQGKAVEQSVKTMGLQEIDKVRVGRHIQLFITADSKETAIEKVKKACETLLVNKVMEQYRFEIEHAE